MKCHILFSEKNKKNISKCRLLKILPRVLSVKVIMTVMAHDHLSVETRTLIHLSQLSSCPENINMQNNK